MTTLVPGLLVGKNVRLVRALAQGGMGAVWVADHLGLGTQVAVKFMTAEVAENAQSVQRFSSEATASARIKSPHVVQVFDHGIADFGMPYIVMELLDGEDLSKRVERLGPLSMPETVKIIGQCCTALGKAHALGIVHRDLKPENIFLIDSGGEIFVKVLDFGIAKQTSDVAHGVTSTGMIVGTPSYMSPEQVLSAKHLDHRSDIWSLGVVAYHCLTARVPFHGESFGALAVAIHQSVFSPPSSIRGNLPPGVDAWFARAMARAPEDRFNSAKEMADALAAVSTWGTDRTSMQSHPGSVPPSAMGGAQSQGYPSASQSSSSSSSSPGLPRTVQSGSGPAPTFDGAAFTQGGGQRRTGVVAMVLVAVVFAAFGAGVFIFFFMRSHAKPEPAPVLATTTATVAPSASATAAPTVEAAASVPSVTPLAPVATQAEPSKKPGPAGHVGHPAAPVTAAPPVAAPPPAPAPPPPSPKVPDRGF